MNWKKGKIFRAEIVRVATGLVDGETELAKAFLPYTEVDTDRIPEELATTTRTQVFDVLRKNENGTNPIESNEKPSEGKKEILAFLTSFNNLQLKNVVGDIRERIKNGQKLSDPWAKYIKELKKADLTAYEILLSADIEELVDAEIIIGLFLMRTFEATTEKGDLIYGYIGKTAGKGANGQVRHIYYINPQDGKIKLGALKTSVEGCERLLNTEKEGQKTMNNWEHSAILRAIHMGEGFIIYETHKDSFNMRMEKYDTETDERMRDLRLPLGESLKAVISIIEVIKEFQSNGYFHGDIKPSNILIMGGKPKLIDSSPMPFETIKTAFPTTKGFGYNSQEIKYFLKGRNLSQEATYELARGFDMKAVVETIAYLLTIYGAKNDNTSLLKLFEGIRKDPEFAGDPLTPSKLIDGINLFIQENKVE